MRRRRVFANGIVAQCIIPAVGEMMLGGVRANELPTHAQ
jgi:hypothetical protein